MDGPGYLEKVIGDRLGDRTRGRHEDAATAEELAELKGVAAGLVAAGALSTQAMRDILARTGVDPPRGPVVVHRRAVPTFQLADTQERRQAVLAAITSPAPTWRSGTLQKVVSLVGQELVVGEITFTLIGVDLWSTIFVLRMAHSMAGRQVPEGLDYSWRAEDNLGISYRGCGGSGSDAGGMVFQQLFFQPGLPSDATELVVSAESQSATATAVIHLR